MKHQTRAMEARKNFEQFRRPTRRDMLLKTKDKMVPWQALCSVVEPYDPMGEVGRPPIGLERVIRMLFGRHWFKLADEAC
jgi:IS5 family transposase